MVLILGWFCASYYSGPVATSIEWICKIGLGAILVGYIWDWYKNFVSGRLERQKRCTERQKQRAERRERRKDPDPKPRPEDFMSCADPPIRYKEALTAWEDRMKKRIVYELPVEVAVNMDNALDWYWKEVLTRNPARFRESVAYMDVAERDCYCEICGGLVRGKRKSPLAICNGCHELYDYETFRKKIPVNLSADSAYRIWERQMIAATDCEDGVIPSSALAHELELAIALEYKLLEQRRKETQSKEMVERNRQRIEQQKQNNVVAAQRLL